MVQALLDTGATVSLIQNSLVKDLGLNIEPVTNLNISCANGQDLPYIGFTAAEIALSESCCVNSCLLLVVPDSANQSFPVLLGTNILDILLQNAPSSGTLDLVANTLNQRRGQLAKLNGSIGTLHVCETDKIQIMANSVARVPVKVHCLMDHPSTHVIVEDSSSSSIGDLKISPTLHIFDRDITKNYTISVTNPTASTVTIEPGALIAQISPVILTNNSESTDSILPEISSDLSDNDKQVITNLLESYSDIFSQHDGDIGHYSGTTHRIELEDSRPFKQKFRRIPPHMYEEVADHLKILEANGIIRPSKSPYSSPVVCVRKKDGGLRLCVDYRLLNSKTIKDNYSLPRVDEILDSLQGAKYFTKLDLKSGYHQIEIEENHKERTAFTVGPLGFWEHNRLAFGLCNSPPTFQRVMEQIFSDMNLKSLFIYIDDVIVYSKTIEEHISRLTQVFERLRDSNLKLAPQKCEVCKTSISFLGFIVSEEGIQTDPDKVNKVASWPEPQDAGELREFLGFAGYYRRFVENFSGIVKPLNELLPPTHTKEKGNKKNKKSTYKTWQWNEPERAAFQTIKKLLCSAPVLAYADFTRPFQLHVDSSGHSLGAVLYQNQDNGLRPIAYASRSLNKAERNYPAHKREFLALKWAIVDKFNDYLWGAPKFIVKTDNNPLTYVLSSAKLDSAGHRWLSALAAYDFEIQYVPGISHKDADGLSRIPHRVIDITSVQAICNSLYVPFSACMGLDLEDEETHSTPFPKISLTEIRKAQNADPIIGPWMSAMRTKKLPHFSIKANNETNKHSVMKRNWSKFKVRRGVLYRESENSCQLVLPSCYITQVLEALHDDCGHPGIDKTTTMVKQRFFWPLMTTDISDWVDNCGRCIRFKARPELAPLVGIVSTEPLELVCTDFLKVDSSSCGTQYILVVTDHFTRFAQAYPTRNMSAKTTAEALLNFCRSYGIPRRLHSDQGANFESNVIRELCNLLNVNKSRTTPFHPMGNGSCERFNRTLINMLGTLTIGKKKHWPKHLGMLVLSYNATPHDSTGFSPFFLFFGRQPQLPIDNIFGRTFKTQTAEETRAALEWAWLKAAESDKKSKDKSAKYYNKKVRGAVLEPGDLVLVKECTFEGPHKIQDKWSSDTYTVVEHKANLPVYVVKRHDGKLKTLHRNLLLPVASIREPETPQKPVMVSQTPQPESVVVDKDKIEDIPPDDNSDEESSDEDIFVSTTVPKSTINVRVNNHENTDDVQQETPVSTPIPLPRRSNRLRNLPARLASGDFVYKLPGRVEALSISFSTLFDKLFPILSEVPSGLSIINQIKLALIDLGINM